LSAAAGSGKEVELAYFSGGERRTTVVKLANVATGPGVVDAGPAAPRVVERLADPLVNPPNNAAERIEQLERRIRELEQRVAELERSARRSP